MDAELTSANAAPARRRRMAEETRHVLVGAAVVFCLVALFAVSAGKGGGRLDSYRLIASFATAEGVFTDAPVRLAGVQIGRVAEMDYDSERQQAVVTMEIAPEVELPMDSIAIVTSDGMIGGRFIRLEPGGEVNMLRDGDRMEYTQGSILFEDLLAKVIISVEKKRQARREAGERVPEGGIRQ